MRNNKYYNANVILPGSLLGLTFFTVMITPQSGIGQNGIALEAIITGVSLIWLIVGLFQWRNENKEFQKKQKKNFENKK